MSGIVEVGERSKMKKMPEFNQPEVVTASTGDSDPYLLPVRPPPPSIPSLASLTLKIWPPSRGTRDAVALRLVETMTTPSVITRRHGCVPRNEVSSVAQRIEEDAFVIASGNVREGDDDDGMDILQIYSQEISKMMLAVVKEKSSAAGSTKPIVKDSDVDHTEENRGSEISHA